MLLAVGVVLRPVRGSRSGQARSSTPPWSMGPPLLTTFVYGLRAGGLWHDRAGTNSWTPARQFYEVYDGRRWRATSAWAGEPSTTPRCSRCWSPDRRRLPQLGRGSVGRRSGSAFTEVFKPRGRGTSGRRMFADIDACVDAPLLDGGGAAAGSHDRAGNVRRGRRRGPTRTRATLRTPGAITRSAPDPGWTPSPR